MGREKHHLICSECNGNQFHNSYAYKGSEPNTITITCVSCGVISEVGRVIIEQGPTRTTVRLYDFVK